MSFNLEDIMEVLNTTCSKCNTLSTIEKIIKGKPVCNFCFKKFYNPCDICKNYVTFIKNVDTKLICSSCYNKFYRPKKVCSICNKLNIVTKFDEGRPVCGNCYRKLYQPLKTCHVCHQERKSFKNIDKKSVCKSCYYEFYCPKHPCSICNKLATTTKYDNGKPICASCYQKYYVPRKTCNICNKEYKTLRKVNDKFVCPTCCYKLYGVCVKCGKSAKGILFYNNMCSDCWYTIKIDSLLLESKNLLTNNYVYNLFAEYTKMINAYRKPSSSYENIQNRIEIFRKMNDIVHSEKDITQEIIDRLIDQFNRHSLCPIINFFIKINILKPVSSMERFNKLRSKFIEKLPVAFSNILKEYTNQLINLSEKYEKNGKRSTIECLLN